MEDLMNSLCVLKQSIVNAEESLGVVYLRVLDLEEILLDYKESKTDNPYHKPPYTHDQFMEDVRKLLSGL